MSVEEDLTACQRVAALRPRYVKPGRRCLRRHRHPRVSSSPRSLRPSSPRTTPTPSSSTTCSSSRTASIFSGRDSLGRDTLSRIIYGARITLLVGVGTVLIAAALGTVIGLIAGYFGGWLFTDHHAGHRRHHGHPAHPARPRRCRSSGDRGQGGHDRDLLCPVPRLHPVDLRPGPFSEGKRVCHGGPLCRGRPHRHHVPPYPAQLYFSSDRPDDDDDGARRPYRGVLELSRSRHQAAVGCLGFHGL